ncbi:MAG TPA: L-fucose/L-arabinose isomerase family protein [Tepidisphaeraceae bacterium]|jgi:L-fucose isomerase-like protein|nr:L-fucose/L-arabinose isomerase family protein [Tepidisphaeraceae bacterium]
MSETTTTLGVIIGNRDFFPDVLVGEARKDIVKLFEPLKIKPIMLTPEQTKLGGVETYADARKCADLFSEHRKEIDGVLVVLPNFGDEKGVADTLKLAALNVPVLVQGYPDDLNALGVARRRDSFCGKISVCNNLTQARIPFTLTKKHVVHPTDPTFKADLAKFVGVCRTVKGLRRARFGAVGARPGAFNTVRYSEKILENYGISVTTVDLSEILGKAQKLDGSDARVKAKLDAINNYAPSPGVPSDKMIQMSKLGVVLDEFVATNDLQATAIQCWTSLQQNYGCNVCTCMSMMSQALMPSACEVDITGALSMYALSLASQLPSALVDWNNNYGGDEDKCVLFHCGNWPKAFAPDTKIANAPILGSTLGVENTYGAMEGRTPAGPLTYARFTTDDTAGVIRGYVGEGETTNDTLETFGHRAVAKITRLQELLQYVCNNGFEHHVAVNGSHVGEVLTEACGKYLGWAMYQHK